MNVIMIVCDALRSDRLSYNGYKKPTSPNIDMLAKESVVFKNAFSQFNTTVPSVTSILTGRYPWTTGIVYHPIIHHAMRGGVKIDARRQQLSKSTPTLAEILYRNGYKTFTSMWLGAWFKRGNIWSMPHEYFEPPYPKADMLVDWALTRMSEKPYFLYLHFWETHFPYVCDRKYADQFYYGEDPEKGSLKPIKNSYNPDAYANFLKYSQGIKDLAYFDAYYDGELNFLDEQIGRLLQKVDEDTLIILTADHGDNLGEGGIYYCHYHLRDNIVHVPLMFKHSSLTKATRKGNVELVDIAPSLLSILDIKHKIPYQGSNLFDLSCSGKNNVYAMETRTRQSKMVRDSRYKLVAVDTWIRMKWQQPNPVIRYELYDLQNDPKEKKNIAYKQKKLVGELYQQMANKIVVNPTKWIIGTGEPVKELVA